MRKAAIALLVLVLLIPTADAGDLRAISPPNTTTLTIAMGEYEAFRLDVTSATDVNVTITVTSGGEIDIYVTDEAGFSQYEDPNATGFPYFSQWTAERVRAYNRTIIGPKYIIVDNVALTPNGAMPEGTVTVTVEFTGPSSFLWTGLAVALVAVLAVVAAIVLRARRRRRETAVEPTREEPTEGEAPKEVFEPPPPPSS